MLRVVVFLTALAVPSVAAAQQPCTPDARHVINELYRTMLDRSAGRASNDFVQRLDFGRATVRDLVYEVATSREYMQRFVKTGDSEADRRATVTALYRHILGREPDADGLQAHMEGLRTRGFEAVVQSMLASDEYRQKSGDQGVPGTSLRFCGGDRSTSNRMSPQLRAMDRNDDGRITRAEWRGSAWAFNTLDANGDGVLWGDEVGDTSRNGVVGTTGTFDSDDIARRFDAFDRNADGQLQRNEWTGTAADFDRLDRNRNNLLSRAEVAAASNRTVDEFLGLDLNNDGRLTIQEWNWNRRSFEQQDTNGDGVITRDEFRGRPGRNRTGF